MIALFAALIILSIFVFLHSKIDKLYPTFINFHNRQPTIIVSTPTDTNGFETTNNIRLPQNIVPSYYKLKVIPYLEEAKNFTMDGTVQITFTCLEPTNVIVLHSKNNTIDEPLVTIKNQLDSSKMISIKSHAYDLKRDFYEITLNEYLKKDGVYKLFIPFTTDISEDLNGFYKSSYVDKGTNVTRYEKRKLK